jgi:restriction endonuclease Mrr
MVVDSNMERRTMHIICKKMALKKAIKVKKRKEYKVNMTNLDKDIIIKMIDHIIHICRSIMASGFELFVLTRTA